MSLTCERRSGEDRRQRELGLRGRIERRQRVEPRTIEIVDVVLSEAEWELHFGNRAVRVKKSVTTRPWGQPTVKAFTRNHKQRSGDDRRQEDLRRHGERDRRKKAESRKPEVFEIELTPVEWAKLFGDLPDSDSERDIT